MVAAVSFKGTPLDSRREIEPANHAGASAGCDRKRLIIQGFIALFDYLILPRRRLLFRAESWLFREPPELLFAAKPDFSFLDFHSLPQK
jgi:hypothetical protein